MPSLPKDIKDIFFRAILGLTPMIQFEKWVYSNEELAKFVSNEDYIKLVELNYKNPYAPRELWKWIEKYAKKEELENYKILQLLLKARQKDEELPFVLMELYDLYCDGCNPLQDIAINYGLNVRVPMINEYKELSWHELKEDEQKDILKSFSPGLEEEIDRLILLFNGELL